MTGPIREIAIIGAGNGGCAAAADLTLRGFSVRLYGRSPSTIAPIKERGGIELSGSLGEHFAPIAMITSDAGEAMRGADLVVLMGPTHAHGAIAETIAPHIAEDQILLAAPGHTVLLIPNALRAKGRKLPAFCDTASLPYIARKSGPAAVRIMQAAATWCSRRSRATAPPSSPSACARSIRRLRPAPTCWRRCFPTPTPSITRRRSCATSAASRRPAATTTTTTTASARRSAG